MVLLAQGHHQIVCGGFLWLRARPVHGRDEELGIRITAELMAKNAKRARSVAEGTGDDLGGLAFEEVGA